jgi:type II secretory pathway component GspD/PulD (secretin)
MKRFVKNFDQYRRMVVVIFWLACCCGLLFPASAVGEKSVADEIISLEVADKPLGEVLENISDATGCQFTIDASWEDYPITASFKNEPLYRVLKRILHDFNNAVIYGSDRRIKIIIYDESAPSGKKAGYSVAIKPAEAAISQTQPYSDATAPQPEVQAPEESSSAENVEQPSEENAESVSEVNPADTENPEAAKEESGEVQAEEKTAAVEAEPNENTTAQDSLKAEPAESASDSSESTEKKENSEESNQN